MWQLWKRRKTRRKIVFVHIPKTGGTTFRGILQDVYGKSFRYCTNPSIAAIRDDLESFDCVELHFAESGARYECILANSEVIAQQAWSIFGDAEIFLMLRDPVDQSISQFFHNLRNRELIAPMYRAAGAKFPECVEDLLADSRHFNQQLRFLCDKLSEAKSTISLEDLAKAKKWLVESKIHVGLTERFGDSLHIFESVTGHRIPRGIVELRNKSLNRPPPSALSPATVEKIRSESELDNQLYAFGKQLFEAELARFGPAPNYDFHDEKV